MQLNYKKITLLIFFIFLLQLKLFSGGVSFSLNLDFANKSQEDVQDCNENFLQKDTCYSKIAKLYLPSITEPAKENRQIENKTESPKSQDKNNNQEEILTEKEKIELTFRILSSKNNKKKNLITNDQFYKDLEIFCGNSLQNPENNLLSKIDHTNTYVGKIYLANMLYQPETNMDTLEKKQLILKELINNQELFAALDAKFEIIKKSEIEILWLWKTLSKEATERFNQLYFSGKILSKLNENSHALNYLTISQTIAAPLINVAIQETFHFVFSSIFSYVENGKFDLNWIIKDMLHDYHPTLWMQDLKKKYPKFENKYVEYFFYLFWAQNHYFFLKSIYDSVISTVYNLKSIKNIQEKMIRIASYINTAKEIEKLLSQNQVIKANLQELQNIQDLNNIKEKNHKNLIKNLETKTFKNKASVFSNYGRVLTTFKTTQKSKNILIDAIETIGQIDSYMSITKLYKKHENHNAQYCFVKYLKQDKPYINIIDGWSPFLNRLTAVCNNIELGKPGENKNIIITGPNAGGKSTILKSVALTILLGQTIGIAPAKEIEFTPFSYINTYLNISDTAGKESLFQAEMRRALNLINIVKNLKEKEFCFTIMDEIFTGTNPIEGICGAYGIVKKLSFYDKNMFLLATHYKKLTDLENDTNGNCKNYKITAIKKDFGYSYPFKLIPGSSNQTIALDLLKAEGFDEDILSQAYKIMNEISGNHIK
ncbi:MAG: hypothetical protein WC436_03210 [Candidatus Babeliales bacterium]